MTEYVEAATVGDVLVRTAERVPDREAVVFPDARFTYGELLDQSIHAARGLAGLGVRRGDHVGLLMPNCPDMVFAFFGAQLLGAVVVPINSRFQTRELGYVIENADIAVLLTSDIIDEHVNYVERLHKGLPGLADAADPLDLGLDAAPRLQSVVLLGRKEPAGMVGRHRFDDIAAGVTESYVMAERQQVCIRDVALMPYTSGTTAQPKGCMITHEGVVRDWVSAARRLTVTADERFWDPCPLFHMAGIGPMIFVFNLGATFLLMTHFEPGAALEMIEREEATWLYPCFPPLTMGLIRHPDFAKRDLSRARGILNVAPPETLRVMQDAFPRATQISCFGMTEGSGVVTFNEWDETYEQRTETTGPPLPGVQVRIVDPETGTLLGPGEEGELQYRGYNVMEGYYKDPEKTAATIIAGGWLRSGDIGTLDADGRVSYVGRHKDMLKVGGENVAPSEIESHLSTHPAIKLVQVVGVPDERLVEVPVAFVEVAPGHAISAEEVIDYCRGEIASFKVPRHVRFVTEWPLSATKIQKFRLREQILAELAGAAGDESAIEE